MKTSEPVRGRPRERRRYPRAEVGWRVVLEHEGGFRWRGETVGLNPFGAKVRLGTKAPGPQTGSMVRLHFAPPDGKPAMTLNCVVWRVDSEDPVVVFNDLSAQDFTRLKNLTDKARGGRPPAMSPEAWRRVEAFLEEMQGRFRPAS